MTTPDRVTGNVSDTEITAKDSARKKKRKFIKQVPSVQFDLYSPDLLGVDRNCCCT
jgi:hypothetical protein